MKKLLFIPLVFHSYLFAIVSIKPLDVGENALGLSGEVMLSLSSNRGNSQTDAADTGVTLQYDSNQTLTFIKASYTYGEANSETTIDKSFVHLRNIYNISKHLDWETFLQHQRNQFQSLTSRLLLGGGTRINGDLPLLGGKAYLGLGAFHVEERVTDLTVKYFTRGNIYLSYKLHATKDLSMALVSYYQPRFGNGADYLLLSTAQFELTINKSFALKISLNYTEDSIPAQGVSSYDFSQTTALKYNF